MADFGTLSFHSARSSGILLDQLGSGVADHVGLFGPTGTSSAIEVGAYNDTTFIVDDQGVVPNHLGAESGKLTNTKFVADTTVNISGFPTANLTDVNVFDVNNLNTYPDFEHRPSGTLLIRYFASGVSEVRTFNAKLFAYDNTANINTAPPDITVKAFEINGSGQWFNSAHSGVWQTIHTQSNALRFTNHSSLNGWIPRNEHIWVAAISATPSTVGVIDSWDLQFSLEFAALLISAGIGLFFSFSNIVGHLPIC